MPTDTNVDVETADDGRSDLPFALELELTVTDSDTIAELCTCTHEDERHQFALKALRIGVLALRQARGEIDAERLRRESDRLLGTLESRLSEHSHIVHERLTAVLKDYFDPHDGRFQERVHRLIRKDGELERLLKSQIGVDDSELSKTLTAHVGDDSSLMKVLDPDQSQGLLAALRETLEGQLKAQREQVLDQFSLDNKDGALTRFIGELSGRQGELSEQLQGKIDAVVKEFSLDDDDSALSRLVRNVDRAQKTITNEFSLDEEKSALSRLKKMLEETNDAIHGQLSLDDEKSALARLKRELLTLLSDYRETNQKFQEEVRATLEAMVARKQEADRSTRHGLDFEDAVFEYVQRQSQRLGDIAEQTGHTTGRIKNCKVGDCRIELGPDSAAPGAVIAIEAKEQEKYTFAKARDEIETARKNRDAPVGVFVFSTKTAPSGIERLTRHGHDVFVVWDAEDSHTDVYLHAGLTLARALCVRTHNQQAAQQVDFSEMDKAILEVEKRAAALDDVETWASTIKNNSDKILQKIGTTRRSLRKKAEVLRNETATLKSLIND